MYIKIGLSILVVALVWYFFWRMGHQSEVKVVTGLPILHLQDSLPDSVIDYEADCKVIAYLKERPSGNYFTLQNWTKYYSEFQEVSFLFYFHGRDTTLLRAAMDNYNFHHPIIWDPEGEFVKANPNCCDDITFISGVLDSNGNIQLSNPTLGNLTRLLSNCSND
ncbi:hypothetical protein [Marinoscillum sp.]|uniref:hypothetical protein n=1 Tax=Marinoscillum sp. TaxID=2024838 RepID=UPI003BA89623